DLGIQTLWRDRDRLAAPDWAGFLSILADRNPAGGPLRIYPGSPAWMQALARPSDIITAFELHSTEGAQLSRWAEARRVRVRQEDGLRGLLSALPPAQPRLCVLIDPSYEIRSDYQEVAQTLIRAWQRCRHGVFLVWYPILPDRPHEELLSLLKASPLRKVLRSELRLRKPPGRGMAGSGLLVVNPPWGLDERLHGLMAEAGAPDRLDAEHRVDWWLPE
ncbi:MAG: 23S rRNA (adenine(2030)-N(6))-methyltransferase RlmJ, partial [Marinobacter sp.]|uniref:23S rRNA (adenine(2030)-N(6))-methyltransferase RlmJ n=1 Tax=Marinobacter sp. TaxID=50741 RepID=UPI00299EBBBB